MTRAEQAEPPSCLEFPLFMVGLDHLGNWVVQDQRGARGGLFVDRKAALRYVRSENGGRPRAVVMVSGAIELDMTCKPGKPPYQPFSVDVQRRRSVA